jgi:hypothetical protein
MPKPLSMAGIFRLLEKIGHRPQQGLNAKVKHYENVTHVLKRVN